MRDLRFFPERLTRSTRDRLRGAMGDARNALARRQLSQSRNVVEFTRLDLGPLDLQRSKWPKFQQLVDQGTQKVPQFADLMDDLFFGLYFLEPRLRPRDAMLASHRLNYDLYMQTQQLPVWEEARTRAVYNPKHAVIGLVFVAQALLDALDDAQQEQQRQSHGREEQREESSLSLQELIDALADAGAEDGEAEQGDGQPGGSPSAGKSGSKPAGNAFAALFADEEDGEPESEPDAEQEVLAEQAIRDLQQIAADLADDGDDEHGMAQSAMRRAAKNGLEQANQQLDELDTLLGGWGSDPAEYNALPPDKAFAIYERLKSLPNLREFTLELGRMRNAGLDAEMMSNAREPQEIVDVTSGRTWADALPSERLLLGDPRTAPAFWAKMMQDSLLTWAYAGREPANRGPFIVLVDVSGSTMGAPERWGKAFTLAALEIAKREQRDAGVIFFDAIVRPQGVFTFPGGRMSLPDKIDVASYFTGGGTDWRPPLLQALTNIEATDGTWQQADIVLVTDGVCAVSDEFAAEYKARCRAKGVRTHGIYLDGYPGYEEQMKSVCDRVFAVSSLAGAEAAKPIFDLLVS